MPDISGRRTLHRLIYASRQNVAPDDLDHEVGGIVQSSIKNNRLVSVTGLLLFHDGWFVQALEGPAEAVLNTYRRILEDGRHTGSRTLDAGPVESRAFGDWNMCARRMSEADDAILRTLELRGEFRPETFSGRSALTLLKAVRGIQARTQVQAMT